MLSDQSLVSSTTVGSCTAKTPLVVTHKYLHSLQHRQRGKKKNSKNLALKEIQSSELTLSNACFSVTNLLEFYWLLANCHKCIDSVISSLRACFATMKMAVGMEPFTVPVEQIGSQETLGNSEYKKNTGNIMKDCWMSW